VAWIAAFAPMYRTKEVPMSVAQAPAHQAGVQIDRVELAVYRAVNGARRRHGLPRLRLIGNLVRVAQQHSQDLSANGFLSHSSSDGTPFYVRIRRADDARTVGETLIACRGGYSPRSVVRAWMHSPPHRAELMSRAYRTVGVGRAASRGTAVITADFASR
jgi:uncharacterized protein YkwD